MSGNPEPSGVRWKPVSQQDVNSQAAPPRLRFRVPPEPSHLLRARDRIRDYLRQYCTDEPLVNDVVLCVEEAAANAVRHSGSELDIELSLGFEDGRLLAEVRDHGRGFDITSFDRNAVPDLGTDHGRGLFIIAKLMDSLELRTDGGLEVRMARQAASCHEPSPFDSALGDALDDRGRRNPRTQAMLDEIDEGFVALDWEYRYVHVNEAMLRLVGKSRDEVIGKVIWELFPELEVSSAAEQYRAAMELGEPSVFERRAIVGDDWFEVRVYPTPAGISIYFREINERKRTEQALVSSRAELATALAAITDGFYTLDRRWRVTYLNDKAAEVFPGGKDALGADFWELFPGDVGSAYEVSKCKAMEEGEVGSFEFFDPAAGAWFEERDYPSADGITVLFADITGRKRAEAERDQLMETKNLLLEAATTATAWTDLDPMLESLGDLLLRATDHSRILIQLWDEERREVEIAVSRGAAATPKQRFAFDGISDGAKEVITTHKMLIIDYAATSIPSLQKEYVDEHAFLLMLVVPIVYRERLIGLITLDQPGEHRPFGAKEIELVEAIAAQASTAIANAQLNAEQRQVAERLEHVLANTADGFFIFDRDWRYIYVNDSGANQSQKSREELVGQVFWDVFPDVVGTEIYENLTAAAADGKPRRYEVYYEPYDMSVEHRVFPQTDSTAVFVRDVTEQRRAERNLKESEQRLRLATEAARLGIQDYDVRSETAHWDARVRELWGVDPDEPITYETFLSGLHPDDCEATLAVVDAAMDPRGAGNYEATYRVISRADHQERWVHATWQVSFADGHAVRMVGTVEDVTERRWAEEALQRSESRYRELVQNANSAIVRWSCDGTITFVNEYAQKLFGWGAEEAVGKSVNILVPEQESDGTDLTSLVKDILKHPEHYESNTNENLCRDGRRLWLTWTNRAILDDQGEVAEILAVGNDVTGLKRAEEALRESDEKLRTLFATMDEGFAVDEIVCDENGQPYDLRYLEVNPAFERHTGLKAADILGHTTLELFPDAADDPVFEIYGKVALTGEPAHFESQFGPLGRWFEVSAYQTEPGRFATVFIDTTARKRAEEERERLLERLSRSIERELRATRSAETLAKVNEILLSARTPDDVIARLVGEASEAAGADKALVIRVGDEGSFTITHVRNLRGDLVGKAKNAKFYPGFALAAAERRPILIADNWADGRLNKDFVVPYGLHAFQLLPLIVDEKVSYVLALSYDEAQAFDDEDYRAAERMAEAMSLALRNALLFEAEQEARQRAAEQLEFARVLLDVSRAVANWTELQPMLEGLADALLRAAAHSRVTIG